MTQAELLREKMGKVESLIVQVHTDLVAYMREIDTQWRALERLAWQPSEAMSKSLRDDLTLLEVAVVDALEAAGSLSRVMKGLRDRQEQERRK